MRLIQLESLLVKAVVFALAFYRVHRCSLNGVVQVVDVAEYVCKEALQKSDWTPPKNLKLHNPEVGYACKC